MALRKTNSIGYANVAFVRAEAQRLMPQYLLIRDCLSGEPAIKAAKTKYLPMPNSTDKSPENLARYDAYLTRAVFYNVTEHTLSGLIGQVFMRDPAIKLPAVLEPVKADATGTGISLIQSAQLSLGHTVAYSRTGLFVDFTDTGPEGASAEQVERGEARPTIYAYSPLEIINWRVIEVGSKEVLSLVVLLEGFQTSDDGFEIKESPQFRVLKLVNGVYVQEIWRQPQPTTFEGVSNLNKVPKGNFQLFKTVVPKGSDGQPMREIPFKFVGSKNNDINPDNPNLYNMAAINIAHYRNSADYEESCYIVGQATPVATGLTQEWVEKVLNGVLAFGSRGGIPLPTGANAALLQAQPNSMLKEAMDDKVKQMVSLGAKLVEDKQVQRTAFEAKLDSTAEGSVLSSSAKNVSAAYLWALKLGASLMGANEAEVEFELNTDFDLANITPEETREAVDLWIKEAISWDEMRARLRRAGIATEDDKKAKAAIEKDKISSLELLADNDPQFKDAPQIEK